MSQPKAYSLRTLLIGLFLSVAMLATLIAGVMLVTWRLPMVQQQTQTEQIRLASMVLQQLEVLLETTEKSTLSVARVLSTVTPQAKREEAMTVITQISGHAELFESLYILDKNFKVLSAGSAVTSDLQAVEWMGYDLSGLPIVQRVRQQAVMSWSEQYASPLLGVPVVALALPVGDYTLLAEVSVARLVDYIRRSSDLDDLLVLLMDGKGEIVAAPDMQLARSRSNFSNISVVRAALDGAPMFDTFEFADRLYSGTARRSGRLGWVVVAAYPKAVADASRRVAMAITGGTLLAAILVGIVTFGLLASLIQRRVRRTVAYAQDVAQGRYTPPDGHARIQELQLLDASLQQMAQTIQRREQQLRAIVETTPTLAIQWFDKQGRVVDWNPASETMLGWTREQALGKTLDQLIYTPAQQQDFMAVLADIERTGQPFGPFDGIANHQDGQTRNILSTTFAIPGTSDGLLFVCMDIDITEMKQKEQEIRANEQKFNLFFNASPVAVAVMEKRGADYAYVDVNQAWEKLSGYTRAQALGSDLSSGGLVVDPADRHKLLGEVDAAPVVENAEIWATRADGQKFLAEGSLGQVTVAGHELLIYSLHDITDKRQMENELREFNSVLESRIQDRTESLTQANLALQEAVNELRLMQDHLVQSEKLASLGALVAGIAHELNTPIGNGLMAVSTLEQRTRSFRTMVANGLRRSDLEAFLSQVETAGDIATRNLARAAELITGFKRVAVDQTSAQRREFELAELVHEILLTLQPMIKRTTIQVQVNVPAMTLDGYPGPLGQVISNLIQNAVLHAFEGRPNGHIFISARANGDQVDLEVADDGHGIPQELVRRVFDPFFTTRLGKGGSGLGLHIVHNLITGLLGGYIELLQAPGGGARFAIHLPRCAPELSAAP